MKQKQAMTPPMNIGISLLLVVFLTLCLFTFAAIALTSAQNEYENSLDMANRTKTYYGACSEAERTLSELSMTIQTGTDVLTQAREYSFSAGEDQQLFLRVEPADSAVYGKSYRITQWRIVPSGDWQSDDTIDVLIPEITE